MAHKGITVLLLALRGGKEKPASKVVPGKLIWGTLTGIGSPKPKFKRKGSHRLSYCPIADRGAADLYVVPKQTNSWDVYSVATRIQESWDLFDPLCT